jgi:signal peptidase I
VRALLRGPRLAGGLAIWLVAGLAAGLVLAAGAPVLLGMRSFTVMSGSMRPALGVGDVVVTKKIPARDARVGDVITFQDPGRHSRLTTHRVVALNITGNRMHVSTKGDANDAPERWTVRADGSIGRVVYHLPLIGYALVWTHGRYARMLLVVIPAVLLGVIELGRIWRPRRPQPQPVDVPA